MRDWLIVVPARLASERLPRKPLQDLAGKPLVVRVCENLTPMRSAGASVVVATDDADIAKACTDAGFEAMLTRPDHQSGTDRVYEVAAQRSEPLIMNVQCDEPFLAVQDLKLLAEDLMDHDEAAMATLVYPSTDSVAFVDPNVVKAVVNQRQEAVYFSRAPIPYLRGQLGGEQPPATVPSYYHHLGIYGFRRERLAEFCQQPPGEWEQRERLEQLRALEQGWIIRAVRASHLALGIDTPEDLAAARARFEGATH